MRLQRTNRGSFHAAIAQNGNEENRSNYVCLQLVAE